MDSKSEFEYKFRFIQPETREEIVEIHYLHLPKDAPKSQKYQWFHLVYHEGTPVYHKLDFLSMDGMPNTSVRTWNFVQGELMIFPESWSFHNEITKHFPEECIWNNQRFIKYQYPSGG
jgi:hypothetical protein